MPEAKALNHDYSKKVSNSIAVILRSYAQAINKRMNRTGSLFQQKTKAKNCNSNDNSYPFTCFHYIHQNPLRSKLVKDLSHWQYSSYLDYLGNRNGTLINKKLANELLEIPKDSQKFLKQSSEVSILDFKP